MASSQRQRPQLHVDMSLQPSLTEDEPEIRMNVISKKRRLRYALLEESSDEEDGHGFESQQSAGQEPFEGTYQHTQLSSAPHSKQSQEEQFVLPPLEHGSSSSESDSEEEEEEEDKHEPSAQRRESAMMMMQPPVHEYDNENDLFDAAFVAPENRFSGQHAGEKENAQQNSISSMHHHPFRQNPPPHHANEPQVFDLCASEDEEQDVDFTAEHRATFLGVRREDKSPRFNANSRHVFSPNVTAATAAARRPSPPTTTTTNIDNDDDIVECWSSEDEEGNTKPRARRVTNDAPWNHPKQCNHSNKVASRKHAPRSSSTFHHSNNDDDDDDDDFDRMPAPSRQKHVLNQFKANGNTQRRLRDATTGMHSAASIPFSRNDLHGGSGVGMGNYTFTAGQSFQQSFQQPVAPVATGGGRKQKAATKKGGKKRGGGGKRSYYRKKGGGKKKKLTSGSRGGGGGGRGRGASRSKRGAGSNEEYSRQDPLLKNVGGASIIF